MALLTVLDTEGRPHLVHSSIFDQTRAPRLLGEWSDVWDRIESATVDETAQLVDIHRTRIARGSDKAQP